MNASTAAEEKRSCVRISSNQNLTDPSTEHWLTLQNSAHGVTFDGGFAEYCAYPCYKIFKIHNLSDVDATLLEPYVLTFSALCG